MGRDVTLQPGNSFIASDEINVIMKLSKEDCRCWCHRWSHKVNCGE